MRVLLLNPPSGSPVLRDYYCSSVSKADYLWSPIDLLAQSGMLSQKHEIKVLDAVALRMSDQNAARFIGDFSPEAVFSLTNATTWKDDFRFIEPLKLKIGFKLVMSGEIFLGAAEKILEANSWIDAALLNFVSRDLSGFLDGSTENATNLVWRDGDEIKAVKTKAKGSFSIGLPRHDLFPISRYRTPWQMYHPFAAVMTDYGCPFGCAFCNSRVFGYATRDLDDVKTELDWLYRRGFRQLFIKDMTFGASKPHTTAVLEMMIEADWKFRWNAYTRADLVDDDFARLMRRAGCHLVQIGVESADEKLLEKHDKKIKMIAVQRAFRALRDAGIEAGAHFIVGLPGDSLESVRRTVDFAIELNPVYASFNLAMPRLGASLDDSGWMDRPLDSSGAKPFYELEGMSASDLISERKKAIRRFYLSPAYFFRVAGAIKTASQAWNVVRQAAGLLARNSSR